MPDEHRDRSADRWQLLFAEAQNPALKLDYRDVFDPD
jgi:hypothetical protein